MNRKHMNGCCGCGSTGPPPPFLPIPGCFCKAIPSVLRVVPNAFCSQVFQACTLRWGPRPAGLDHIGLGAYCFLSDESFYHDFHQVYYRWHLSCDVYNFGIRRLFLWGDGSGGLDSTLAVWSIGFYGSTCSPFRLNSAIVYPGGGYLCEISISG